MSNDQPQLTVFVSSMIGPLWDERVIVEEAIRTGIPLARTWVFERAPASSEAIAESYLARVRECDVYLLILGDDVSDPVKDEYQMAVECGKPRLCFVQEGVERTPALKEFLPILKADVKYATFSDEESLRREVLQAVRLELVRGYRTYRLEAAERLRVAQDIEVPPEIRRELMSVARWLFKKWLSERPARLVEAGTRWGVLVSAAGMTLAGIIKAALVHAKPGVGLTILPVFALAFLQQLSASIGGDLLAGLIYDVAKGEDPGQEAVLGALQEVLEKAEELSQLRALLEETKAIEIAAGALIGGGRWDLLAELRDEMRTNRALFEPLEERLERIELELAELEEVEFFRHGEPPLLRRFTDVRFPEQCRIYQPVRLSVQLTLKPVEIETDLLAAMLRSLPPLEISFKPTAREVEERQVELTVFVSADSFEIDRRWRKLGVPFSQDSDKVEFELVGQKLGAQIAEIEFFHGAARVGYVVVETQVVDDDTLGQDAQVTYEAVDDRVWSGTLEQPTATVIANWQEDKGIDYWILERNARIPVDGGSIPVAKGEEAVAGFWEDLSALLGEVVRLSGPPGSELVDSIWLNIGGLGHELSEKLLPTELQSHSSTWPVGSIVVIATNEQWIPWELIYDGDDFWGSKFILARVPKIPGQSAFSASDETVERYVSRPLRKIVNVIGGELRPPQIVERIRELFTAFWGIPLKAVERATLAEVSRSIADADLIHFTCHGHTTPRPCLQLADDLSLIRCLTPSNLQNLPQLTDSVIFANACTSAVVTPFLGELRNFGWEFYKKGAAAYIGTLGLVPTEYAVEFAERFYERLLKDHTVGESLHYAKSKAKRENPFWLLYTLYGDPFARKSIRS